MPLNLFLLSHKCGNNYVQNLHKLTDVPFRNSVMRDQASSIPAHDLPNTVTNIRCRNFSYATLSEADLLDRPETRYLIFTRHPASFVRSASLYHLRGGEKWARQTPQPHFDGKPLTQALREAQNDAEREILTMIQFRDLYLRQTSFTVLFEKPNCLRIRTEDLFTTKDPAYYRTVAEFLRLADWPGFIEALKQASPAFKNELPKHSTGAFKSRDPYAALADGSKEYYDENFSQFASALGY